MITFIPAMNVKIPAGTNILLDTLWESATMEPGSIFGSTCPPDSIPEGFFGHLHETEPLNDRFATLGYDTMTPVTKTGTTAIILLILTIGIVVFFINVCIHSKRPYNFTAERYKWNFAGMVLWGSMINLIMAAYLPVMIAVFISMVGIHWSDSDGPEFGHDIWAIFMMNVWLIAPVLLFIVFMRNPNRIGELHPMVQDDKDLLQRDPSKVYWKRQWGKEKIKALQDTGKLEIAVKEAKKLVEEYIKPAEGQARKAKIELSKSQQLAEKMGEGDDEDRHSLIRFSSNIGLHEEPKTLPGKLNAWKICNKQLPAWCVPRNRNKNKDES